eukprot:4935169-Alexandrium_andersonii.AAC.1
MHDGMFVGSGACAEMWGGVNCQPTCRAHGAKVMTRADYIIVSPELHRMTCSYDVGPQGVYDVHSMVSMVFAVSRPVEVKTWIKPGRMVGFAEQSGRVKAEVEAAFA